MPGPEGTIPSRNLRRLCIYRKPGPKLHEGPGHKQKAMSRWVSTSDDVSYANTGEFIKQMRMVTG